MSKVSEREGMQFLCVQGSQVIRGFGQAPGQALPVPEIHRGGFYDVLHALRDWTHRYHKDVQFNPAVALRNIGCELFDWLAMGEGMQAWLQAKERIL